MTLKSMTYNPFKINELLIWQHLLGKNSWITESGVRSVGESYKSEIYWKGVLGLDETTNLEIILVDNS